MSYLTSKIRAFPCHTLYIKTSTKHEPPSRQEKLNTENKMGATPMFLVGGDLRSCLICIKFKHGGTETE
jgi:hypothetical protein